MYYRELRIVKAMNGQPICGISQYATRRQSSPGRKQFNRHYKHPQIKIVKADPRLLMLLLPPHTVQFMWLMLALVANPALLNSGGLDKKKRPIYGLGYVH